MGRWNKWQAGLRIMLASSLMGTVFQAGCLGKLASNVNPCGTILDCDPVEWDLMFHDYPDWDIDPTCTIPGLCGGNWPPSSTGGTGTTGDTTTTPPPPQTTTPGIGTGGQFGGGLGGFGGSGGFGGFGSGFGT